MKQYAHEIRQENVGSDSYLVCYTNGTIERSVNMQRTPIAPDSHVVTDYATADECEAVFNTLVADYVNKGEWI